MDEKFAALKKYNFWDGNIPALGYLRKHYTDKIADYVGNKLLTAFFRVLNADKVVWLQPFLLH